jgi:hypothetical protein
MRRVWMGVLIPAVLLLFAPAASAGGSWMGVTNIDGTGGLSDGAWGGWAAPGATITMRGAFCDGQQADPSAGPWTAYMSSGDSEMLQPLGQVTIDAAMGNGCPYVASVTFMVPRDASRSVLRSRLLRRPLHDRRGRSERRHVHGGNDRARSTPSQRERGPGTLCEPHRS